MFIPQVKYHPSSPPLWQALQAAKQINLNHFVSLNKRELCSLFFFLLLFPSLFSLFVPFNLVFVSRTGETPEDFFPSENSLFWNSTLGVQSKRVDLQMFNQKWSFAQKIPQGGKVQEERGHQYLLEERQCWNIEASRLVCFLCCLKCIATNLQALLVIHMGSDANRYE